MTASFAVTGVFLTRMMKEAEGQSEVRPLPTLKGDI